MRSLIRRKIPHTEALALSRLRSRRKKPTTPDTTIATAIANSPRHGVTSCTMSQAARNRATRNPV
jgi:hypothetical protein